jgi:GNAT superfamily N-acetyltransferase
MIQIIPADTEAHIQSAITLSQEYVTWMTTAIREHYPELDLAEFTSEHDYGDLRQKFPGEHVPPFGRLYVALNDGQAGGMIALGKLSDSVCEMRTLFVRPEMRGLGMGKQLVEIILQDARTIGYTHMRLDTLGFMDSALRMYRSLGFRPISPYRDVSASLRQHIRFLELDLRSA